MGNSLAAAAQIPQHAAAPRKAATLKAASRKGDKLSFWPSILHPRLPVSGTAAGRRTSGKDLGLAALVRRRRVAAAQEGRRHHQVQLLRSYRTGELPDTQEVTLAAFLAPLGMCPHPSPTHVRTQ